MTNKRVFAMDLFVRDSIGIGTTVENFKSEMGLTEVCVGQEATPIINNIEHMRCIGLDGIVYHVLPKWTRLA